MIGLLSKILTMMDSLTKIIVDGKVIGTVGNWHSSSGVVVCNATCFVSEHESVQISIMTSSTNIT